MVKVLVLSLAAAALVVTLSASQFTRDASADTRNVDTGNLYFCDPSFQDLVCDTSVNAGDTITWTVSAGFHTVTECDETFAQCPPAGGFSSDSLEQGENYSRTFDQAGIFEYYCAFHPTQMRGRILVSTQVTPVPTATPSPTSPGVTAGPATTPGTTATVAPVSVPRTGGTPGNNDGLGVLPHLLGALALLMVSAGFVHATRYGRT
jgi:plastocyanin